MTKHVELRAPHILGWRERLGARLLSRYLRRLRSHYELLSVIDCNPEGRDAAERCAHIAEGLALAARPRSLRAADVLERRELAAT